MAAGSTQLSRLPIDLLDRPITESHLGKLVHCLNLETVLIMAPGLGLTDVQVDDIRDAWPGKPAVQRLEMLKRCQTTYRWVSQSTGIVYSTIDECTRKLLIIYQVYYNLYILTKAEWFATTHYNHSTSIDNERDHEFFPVHLWLFTLRMCVVCQSVCHPHQNGKGGRFRHQDGCDQVVDNIIVLWFLTFIRS